MEDLVGTNFDHHIFQVYFFNGYCWYNKISEIKDMNFEICIFVFVKTISLEIFQESIFLGNILKS